ncbi:ABC1 kinase family protein [Longimicrobium sp.]|uniref:ABC1 kinase family protein n=1 Tax=Longimicrobium sp. TaxID=2029185 RepID=UPI002E33BB7E|nr:AarF/UbiB family protein [Longimicrobium sp.]HEX6042148.1 AarF/UbiB family protein [Longimicrobium sp.]
MHTLRLLFLLLPFALSFSRDRRRFVFWGRPARRSADFHVRRAERLADLIPTLGPTFVKIGQVFSARPDVVPEPYLTSLSTLTDNVACVPFPAIERELVAAYGAPVDQVFEAFEREPLAAGSLGQVYKARYQGEDVVVKVLRPGVEPIVEKDVKFVRMVLRWVERFWSHPQLRGLHVVIDEFERRIADEMDFRKEAAYARAIGERFARNPRVIVPRVIDGMVRPRALVLEFVQGTRVDRIDGLVAAGVIDPEQVMHAVVEAYIQMMLVDGIFHADPHPGNLLVRADGALVLLDFGMVIEVEPAMRHHLVHTSLAAVRGDAEKVVDGFFKLGIVEPQTDRETIHRLVSLILQMTERGAELAEMQRALADEVMHLLYDWPVVLTGEMTYFGRAVALIEGLGAHHIPNFNPVRYVRPLLLKHRTAVLRALGPGDDESVDLAYALGLLTRDVTRVMGNAARELFGVLATRIPTIFGAFTRPAVEPAPAPAVLPVVPPTPALAPAAE